MANYKKKEFGDAVTRAIYYSNNMIAALSKLSIVASEIYGEELTATICNGEEIEFRVKGDDILTISIDDILCKLEQP